MDQMPEELKPVPDPTILTTLQLRHEIAEAKDLLFSRIEGHEKEANERFNGINRQLQALQHQIEQRDIDRKNAVESAFQASEKAMAAALLSAKEAVAVQTRSFTDASAKSEASTTKQIDQIGSLINATVNALNDKIDDIRSRLTTIEGSGKGSKDLMAVIFTVMGIAVAAFAAIIAYSKLR